MLYNIPLYIHVVCYVHTKTAERSVTSRTFSIKARYCDEVGTFLCTSCLLYTYTCTIYVYTLVCELYVCMFVKATDSRSRCIICYFNCSEVQNTVIGLWSERSLNCTIFNYIYMYMYMYMYYMLVCPTYHNVKFSLKFMRLTGLRSYM